jgi:hypothetical protein
MFWGLESIELKEADEDSTVDDIDKVPMVILA